jgi:hypothetical protein
MAIKTLRMKKVKIMPKLEKLGVLDKLGRGLKISAV